MHRFFQKLDGVPEGPPCDAPGDRLGTRPGRRRRRRQSSVRLVAAVSALTLPMALSLPLLSARAAVAPVGSGFTVTPADLAFILKQIKISERHSVTQTPAKPCSTLLNNPGGVVDGIPDAEQVPDTITSYGLRTVDGSCNNLKPGQETLSAADQPFPRLTNPSFKTAEGVDAGFFGPGSPAVPSSTYAQKSGSVFDSQPRVISNLIDDQTSTNPAALAAAAHPVRTQNPLKSSAVPCITDPDPLATPPVVGDPLNCTPKFKTLFIPNVTTDVGLSPPYNSLFTFFGQFFDHGVDQTVKSGAAVFVPLHADDPLISGPDHILGNADDLPASQRFMVLTRAQNQPGPDGVLGTADDIQNANNTDTPWVDQSQTYTSHASHQVFLREYAPSTIAAPFTARNPASVSTGKLLGGLAAGQTYLNSPDGTNGIGTWAAVKKQAAEKLGLLLVDTDVTNIPMLATDPYGKYTPGPNGLPQYVTATGLVEGNLASPVAVPANALHFDTPFLTDIAHNADPSPQDTDHNPATPPVPPVPDGDNTPSADFASQAPGTYDDEMLNAHFACGDGRCNENIALSTIHQVFHSEHDRLVDYIKNVLTTDASASGVAALKNWQAVDATVNTVNPNLSGSGYDFGERLFQAARFVTEMEYQHLVFEEFARKVQPALRPFHVYSPDINPAVKAEFAHAVYRFGHSMLNDTVARTNIDKSDNSVPLLTAFLNPPEYFNGGSAGTLTPEQAAGSVVMGSSSQTGNELDEFVTETLRNNLLGLPLDLPTLNMTRAREAGVPPLNDVRRQIFAQTNDGQLAPYSSWSDFGQHLKHPESLINFVAAYGQHPSITGATTLADKRNAARAIVNPSPVTATAPADVPPADASDFMFSTGAWASDANGVTNTGLDNVDLWVGGLAELTNLFGGLLGSTFNYVFENQLSNLQDGDRLYYLARTPGLNLRSQLEGNSFAELIQRNTDGTNSLKADAFATADCRFQLANLAGTPAGFTQFGSSVADDPTTTDCNENLLLLRQPNGTIQYRQFNSVDPSGINGQSVYNGTPGPDRVFGGNDNDTFWGGAGNDVIEGNGGDDVALGGDGNDIITDSAGNDVHKGGPGNDAIDGGIGNDILHGNDGQDFINGGANDNETFAGPGNDYVIAGQGADAVFGDGGDDWIEGGSGQDLLQGDHGAPFFDDPGQVAPGNDIMIGQPGENDYDAEGGDDIMAANAAIDRFAGAAGWDWAIHQYDTVGADDDMNINNNLVGLPIQLVVNRDRWQETEANSGSAFNDVIKGTDKAPGDAGGAGFAGCDAIDQAGIDRIAGLNVLLPPTALTRTSASVIANSVSGFCPLTGNVWGEGEIILGGGGSDTITGRGVNDIIDGDRSLEVHISVRTNPADPATETGRTDLMENKATSGNFGPGTAGMTLQQAVFAGLVDPGNLANVREIVTAPAAPADCGAAAPVNCDTAVFLGPRSNYSIVNTAATATVPGKITVTQTGANVLPQKISDGVDTLRNIEAIKFTDQTVFVKVPDAPTIGTATASSGATTTGTATVSWTGPVPQPSSFTIVATPTVAPAVGTGIVTRTGIARTALSATISGLVNGRTYTLQVIAVNLFGNSPPSAASNAVTPAGLPGTPTALVVNRGNTTVFLDWNAPLSDGGSPITGYQVQVRTVIAGVVTVIRTDILTGPATSNTETALTNGTSYTFRVRAVNALGLGALSAVSAAATPATVPDAPGILPATSGAAGGAITATANWSIPFNGGSAVTGYRVSALRMAADGVTVQSTVTVTVGATPQSRVFTLTTGNYRFEVKAFNSVGDSLVSARSNLVAAL